MMFAVCPHVAPTHNFSGHALIFPHTPTHRQAVHHTCTMADAPGAAAAADQAKRDLDLQQHLTTGEKNPRNIPTVVFIVRVEWARVCVFVCLYNSFMPLVVGWSVDRCEETAPWEGLMHGAWC